MLNNFISIGVIFIERVLVKTFFGVSILGFFGFASKFSNAILSFHSALKVEYVPSIVKIHLTGTDDARKRILKLSMQNIKRLFIISLFVGLLGIGLYFLTMPISVAGFFILLTVILQAFLNAMPLYCYPSLFLRGKTIVYFKSQISLLFIYLPLIGILIYLFDYYGFFLSLVLKSSLYILILYILIGKQEKNEKYN
jgi:O-antigen/teichoic acid export membrane protein